MDNKDLLKVLDMTPGEQDVWTYTHKIRRPHPTDENRIESFADLAFRLRDEAVNMTNNYVLGRLEVYKHCCDTSRESHAQKVDNMDVWFLSCAKPIHWVIASLIALRSK